METIFDIKFNDVTKVDRVFNNVYFERYYAFFESIDTFTHEEYNLTFNYKYAIEATCVDDKIYYYLYLVPCADSLNKGKRGDIADFCGVDESEITIYDICSYGCGVLMGSEDVISDEIDTTYLDKIASACDIIDSLRGFYLDKPQNRIGTNGWDLFDDYINGKSFLTKVG